MHRDAGEKEALVRTLFLCVCNAVGRPVCLVLFLTRSRETLHEKRRRRKEGLSTARTVLYVRYGIVCSGLTRAAVWRDLRAKHGKGRGEWGEGADFRKHLSRAKVFRRKKTFEGLSCR